MTICIVFWNADSNIYRSQEAYIDIRDMHSVSPAPEISLPIHNNSNGPKPSKRREKPPPVPTKAAKKAGSTENLHKIGLTQSFDSSKEQPQRNSRTFSVIDMRNYSVIVTSILSRVMLSKINILLSFGLWN